MHARNLIAAAALGMVVIALVHAPAWGQKVDTPFRWGSIKKSVGEYMIDIAFNGTSVRSKLPMEFDFGLYKAAPGAPVGASPGAKVPVPDFTSVWVRVSRQIARAKFKSGFRTRAEKAASRLAGQPEILFSGTILRVDNDAAAMTYTANGGVLEQGPIAGKILFAGQCRERRGGERLRSFVLHQRGHRRPCGNDGRPWICPHPSRSQESLIGV
jgi:hypothetical protein